MKDFMAGILMICVMALVGAMGLIVMSFAWPPIVHLWNLWAAYWGVLQ